MTNEIFDKFSFTNGIIVLFNLTNERDITNEIVDNFILTNEIDNFSLTNNEKIWPIRLLIISVLPIKR